MIFHSIFFELLKFGLVGIFNTSICVVVIFLSMYWMGFNPYISNFLGYSVSILNSYLMNHLWIFSSKKPAIETFPRFIGIVCFCYLIQLLFLYICLSQLSIDKNLSQLLAMFIYTITSFTGHKLYSFKK